MSNKNDLNLSVFEMATQFKLLIGFIIAHDYDINFHMHLGFHPGISRQRQAF